MSIDKSPFAYNDKVLDELFIGREDAIKNLSANIFAVHDTTIYGQRKVGKSSLVSETLRQFYKKYKKHLFLNVDISQCASVEEFITLLCREIDQLIKSSKPLQHSFNELSNFIVSIRPNISINPVTGNPETSFDFIGSKRNINKTIDEVFDILETIAKNNKLTVILDEFQSVINWQGSDKFLWQLRSRIQTPNNINFVFLGSSTRLISQLFLESKSAFYKSTNLIYLENYLDWNLLFPWIKKQFAKANLKIENELIKEITDYTRMHPYYTQKLCYFLWRNNWKSDARKFYSLNFDDLKKALALLLKEESMIFQERFDRLTNNQKLILKALANKTTNQSIVSKSIKEKFNLPNRSGVYASIKALEKEIYPLIYKQDGDYIFEDPFFELWLKM